MDEDLFAASEAVEEAAKHAHEEDVETELHEQADRLATLAEREHAPDQARIHKHDETLRDLHGRLNEDARVHLENAMERLNPETTF